MAALPIISGSFFTYCIFSRSVDIAVFSALVQRLVFITGFFSKTGREPYMKVLVSGSRYYNDYQKILSIVKSFDIDLLIAGGCRGADTLAVRAARQCGIKYIEYPADWQRFGKSAGPRRNQIMLDMEKPDLILVFHPDLSNSKGTKDMLIRAKRAFIPYKIYS
jgi:hypothetical protein